MTNRVIIINGPFKGRQGTYIRSSSFHSTKAIIRLDRQSFVFSFKEDQYIHL